MLQLHGSIQSRPPGNPDFRRAPHSVPSRGVSVCRPGRISFQLQQIAPCLVVLAPDFRRARCRGSPTCTHHAGERINWSRNDSKPSAPVTVGNSHPRERCGTCGGLRGGGCNPSVMRRSARSGRVSGTVLVPGAVARLEGVGGPDGDRVGTTKEHEWRTSRDR